MSLEAFSVEETPARRGRGIAGFPGRLCFVASFGTLLLTLVAFKSCGGLMGVGTTRAMSTSGNSKGPTKSKLAAAPDFGKGILAPLLGDGTAVDWWFAFKPTTAAFPHCSTNVTCMFGGDPMKDRLKPQYGLQYILASKGVDGTTKKMKLHSDCLGNGEDPLAKTFQQIYSGNAPNYVVWNDQFYDDPVPKIDPPCIKYCAKPWGHSKGIMAWDDDGSGFVMQVTTPDWPGSGSMEYPRKKQGNTLGCCKDDNVMVAQHFFALRLHSVNDTMTVLQALQRSSVVTDPKNPQLVKLSSGPSELKQVASQLGRQVLDNLEPFQGQLTVRTGPKVHLIAKPSGLHVPPWHLISAILETPLRTATWWTAPAINSTHDGYKPGCWHESLKPTTPEVQVGLSGQWHNTTFSLLGRPDTDGNHAKLGHSLKGPKLAVMSDMNQQGALDMENSKGTCDLSQNARGGLFFVLEDAVLHAGLVELLTGETADYVSNEKPSSTSTSLAPTGCGGAGVYWTSCRQKGCRYVKKADAARCRVKKYGCYEIAQLPAACQSANELDA